MDLDTWRFLPSRNSGNISSFKKKNHKIFFLFELWGLGLNIKDHYATDKIRCLGCAWSYWQRAKAPGGRPVESDETLVQQSRYLISG